jgi:branched-chain amino acid transport system substrate-binding protein
LRQGYSLGNNTFISKISSAAGSVAAGAIIGAKAMEKTKKPTQTTTFTTLGLAALALVAGLALAQTPKTIKIALVGTLTGRGPGFFGADVRRGIEFALANEADNLKKAGITVELIQLDDEGDATNTTKLIGQAINDPSVLAVVGPLSTAGARLASPLLAKAKMPMLLPLTASASLTRDKNDHILRLAGRDDVQGAAGAEYALKTLNSRRVFISYENDEYGKGLAEAFRKRYDDLGGVVAGYVALDAAKPVAAVQQIKLFQPSLVYFAGSVRSAGALVQAMRSAGDKTLFMGGDSLDTSGFISEAGKAALGVLFTSVGGNADSLPLPLELRNKFQGNFGKQPEAPSIYAIDAVNLFLAALKTAGKSPSRELLQKTMRASSLDGVTGRLEFDEYGDRRLANYFITRLTAGIYPGDVVKVIAIRPPH